MKTLNTKTTWLLSASLLALALLSGCRAPNSSSSVEGAAPADSAATAPAPLTLDVVKVTTQKLAVVQNIPGELTAYETVAIFPRTAGFVKAIAVDRGSRVKQGELLVQLEAPELAAQSSEAASKLAAAQSQLAAAQAKLASDQGTYDRLAAAAKTPGVVSGNELDVSAKTAEAGRANVAAAENSVKAAEAARASVGQMENYLRVTAPFDGIVTERNIHPGALVGPNAAMPLLRIETIGRLRLVVPVPESSVANVPMGSRIKFTVRAFPTETFQAPIARVSHSIDTRTRTMPVELEVSNAAGRLTPGTFCQVQWPIQRSLPTHFVPPTAITTNQERTFVIRVPDLGSNAGKAEWLDVQVGATSGNLVEVFGNLNDGDQVALRASDAVRPGSPIMPRLVTPPTP